MEGLHSVYCTICNKIHNSSIAYKLAHPSILIEGTFSQGHQSNSRHVDTHNAKGKILQENQFIMQQNALQVHTWRSSVESL
jgi:hypothetical protein